MSTLKKWRVSSKSYGLALAIGFAAMFISVSAFGQDPATDKKGAARKDASRKMARSAIQLYRTDTLHHDLVEIDRWYHESGNGNPPPDLTAGNRKHRQRNR